MREPNISLSCHTLLLVHSDKRPFHNLKLKQKFGQNDEFLDAGTLKVFERKGKEEYLYSAFIQRLVSRRSNMDHTVLPANYTMPGSCLPFLRKRSTDGSSTKCGGEHLIVAHYLFIDPERMKG